MQKLKIAAFAILGILSVLAISVCIFFIPGSIREGGDTPLLLFNGRILTMDDKAPSAEAVVTEKGRIRYAGSLVEARKMVSPATVMVDLKGKTLIPGFNDNHTHTVMAASYYSELNLWKFIIPALGAVLSWIFVPGEDPEWLTITGILIITISLIGFFRSNNERRIREAPAAEL